MSIYRTKTIIYSSLTLLSIFCLIIFLVGCGKQSYEDTKIGITIKKIGSDLNDRWSLKGVIVETVTPGSPADSRIRAGELLSYIVDERQIDSKKKFRDALSEALDNDKKAILRISKVISAISPDDLGMAVKPDPEERGVIVSNVKAESKADKAGIKLNTVIYTIDDVPVTSVDQYNQEVSQKLQNSGKITVNLAREIVAPKISKVGIEEADNAGKGVVVKKLEMLEVEGSPASMEGIKEGDLITHVIDEMSITDIKSYKKAMKKASKSDRVVFERGELGGIKLTLIDALGEIGDIRAVEPLIKELKSNDRWIRRSAAKALASINDPRIIQPLMSHLLEASESDPEVRKSAADALARMKPLEAIEPLAQALRDTSLGVRLLAGYALGRIGEPAIGVLIQARQDPDSKVRDIAVATLGAVGGEVVKKELKKVLEDQNEESTVKLTAIQALYKIGDPDSIAELKKAETSGDPRLSAFIKELLGEETASM